MWFANAGWQVAETFRNTCIICTPKHPRVTSFMLNATNKVEGIHNVSVNMQEQPLCDPLKPLHDPQQPLHEPLQPWVAFWPNHPLHKLSSKQANHNQTPVWLILVVQPLEKDISCCLGWWKCSVFRCRALNQQPTTQPKQKILFKHNQCHVAGGVQNISANKQEKQGEHHLNGYFGVSKWLLGAL